MNDFKKALKASLPVLVTYIFLGIGFGILVSEQGLSILFSLLSSIFLYAGAGQYLLMNLIKSNATLYTCIFMMIAINIRYAFYGLSFIDKFKKYKWYQRCYLHFALTDETYSILVGTSLPCYNDTKTYDLSLAILNQCYWITGCVLGTFIGKLPIDLTGIDFIMTALFVIIFIEQLQGKDNPHIVSVIGIGSSIISYIIFKDNFVFPAIILSIILIFVCKKQINKKGECSL